MAIEIPNFFEAGGLFDGRSPTVLATTPIVSAEGFLPFDPATSPGTPIGGFTRIASGNYLLKTVQSFDGEEVIALAQNYAGAPAAPAPLIGAAVLADGQITVKDVTTSAPPLVSFAFYLAILRIKYGPNVTL